MKRANDHDLATFRESAREVAALFAQAMTALARKAFDALESDTPEMRPTSWGQALEAFSAIQSLIPREVITAFVEDADRYGEQKAATIDPELDAEGYYPREVYRERDEDAVGSRVPQSSPRPTPPT